MYWGFPVDNALWGSVFDGIYWGVDNFVFDIQKSTDIDNALIMIPESILSDYSTTLTLNNLIPSHRYTFSIDTTAFSFFLSSETLHGVAPQTSAPLILTFAPSG